MTNLERLKIELNNKEYFDDATHSMFLAENDLSAEGDYIKATDQRKLLWTVVDILEAVANDVDIMRRVQTEFQTTTEAYRWLKKRIDDVKKRIMELPIEEEEYSPFTLLYTRRG